MTYFKTYRPYMAYLMQSDIDRLRDYSKKSKVPIAQLIREGVISRVSGKSMYSDGYNDGLTKAIKAVHELKFAQMRFPSGASFSEVVEDELIKHMWGEKEKADEEARIVP